jgi:hypothetical protein
MNTKLAVPQSFTYVILLSIAFFVARMLGLSRSLEIIIPVIMMLVAGWLAIVDLQNITKERYAIKLSNNPDKQRKILNIVNSELRSRKFYTIFYILVFFAFCQDLIFTLLMK